jgi:cytochrome d ubiquinol oxidase subunit II
VADAATRLSVAATATPPGFARVYVEPWLSPFPIALGLLALAMFAFLAATYLTAAATNDALRDDFRRRAYAAAAAMLAAAFGALAVAHSSAPELRRGLLSFTGSALALQSATASAALVALWSLATRRWRVARVAAGAQVSLILWGWVLVQYPYIIPPIHTARDVAAPRATLVLLLAALATGAVVLIPSLAYLYRTFAPIRESRHAGESHHQR